MLPGDLLGDLIKAHHELPFWWLVIGLFLPWSLVTWVGGLLLAGGLMNGWKQPWLPKAAFLIPIELANIATAIAFAYRFDYFGHSSWLAAFAALEVASIGFAIWVCQKQRTAALMLGGFCVSYGAAGAMASAAQFLT